MRDAFFGALAVAALLALAACDGAPKPAATELDDAGATPAKSGPVLDGELGAAVAAVEAKAAGSAPSPANAPSEGPPAGGIFPAGQADALLAIGKRPKLELMSEGSEPRVLLTPAVAAKGAQSVVVTVGMRQGPQHALPTLAFTLSVEPKKPKGAEAEPSASVRLVATVKSAKPQEQPGLVLPKEIAEAVEKMKGSWVSLSVWPDGGVTDISHQLAKGVDPQLEILLGGLVDALSSFMAPVPDKPVGAGAYWMVTDRVAPSGLDVVRYRVLRVQGVDQAGANLSLETRKYAADPRFALPVAGPDAKLVMDQFDAQGKGTLALSPTSWLPQGGELIERMAVKLKPMEGDPRQMALQIESTARLAAQAP